MNLTDFLPNWRHTDTVMIIDGRISLDNFLQLVLPWVDCSVTWCRIAQTCKTANKVCNRLLIRHYDNIGRDTGAELPCGCYHGLHRTWYSDKWCHQLYCSKIYISGKHIKRHYREWGKKGYLKFANGKNGRWFHWNESDPNEGGLIDWFPQNKMTDSQKRELSYIKELPDHLK